MIKCCIWSILLEGQGLDFLFTGRGGDFPKCWLDANRSYADTCVSSEFLMHMQSQIPYYVQKPTIPLTLTVPLSTQQPPEPLNAPDIDPYLLLGKIIHWSSQLVIVLVRQLVTVAVWYCPGAVTVLMMVMVVT